MSECHIQRSNVPSSLLSIMAVKAKMEALLTTRITMNIRILKFHLFRRKVDFHSI